MTFVLPIALVVVSNIIYHICAKSMPNSLNPFASLTLTYLMGAAVSAILYFVTKKGTSFLQELSHLNLTPFVLGIAIVGLEAGFIYAYKVGWQVSSATIVQSTFLALALIAVGFLLYKEPITWNKVVGIVICLVGLVFINR